MDEVSNTKLVQQKLLWYIARFLFSKPPAKWSPYLYQNAVEAHFCAKTQNMVIVDTVREILG